MDMKVEIVSKEMIKPSSPTPKHLQQLKLSFLDQLHTSDYFPLYFFYEAETNFDLLKTSLSKALTHYYPLAGRIRDYFTIDCNDAGALLIEAKVHGVDLLQVIKNPDMDDLKQLLPARDGTICGNGINKGEEAMLAVQINKMDCGGSAIVVQISHKIADVHSLLTFINSWAAICRRSRGGTGGNIDDSEIKLLEPMVGFSSIFPPFDSPMNHDPPTIDEKIVTRRLVFDKEKLEILKHTATAEALLGDKNGSHQVDHPTRFEVVTALIWKHVLDTKKGETGGRNVLAAVHAVNLRSRMNPPLPEHTFGNISIVNVALNEEGDGYKDLVTKLRVAVKKVNETYVKSIQEGEKYLQTLTPLGNVDYFRFTSWSRFPVYEVDYGWGKPAWVTTTHLPIKDAAVFLSTKSGDGLEVLINILEKDSKLFETDLVPKLYA